MPHAPMFPPFLICDREAVVTFRSPRSSGGFLRPRTGDCLYRYVSAESAEELAALLHPAAALPDPEPMKISEISEISEKSERSERSEKTEARILSFHVSPGEGERKALGIADENGALIVFSDLLLFGGRFAGQAALRSAGAIAAIARGSLSAVPFSEKRELAHMALICSSFRKAASGLYESGTASGQGQLSSDIPLRRACDIASAAAFAANDALKRCGIRYRVACYPPDPFFAGAGYAIDPDAFSYVFSAVLSAAAELCGTAPGKAELFFDGGRLYFTADAGPSNGTSFGTSYGGRDPIFPCRHTGAAFRIAASVGLCDALGWSLSFRDGRIVLTVPLAEEGNVLRDPAEEAAFISSLRGTLSRYLFSCLSPIARQE